jgi:hypothetical protein
VRFDMGLQRFAYVAGRDLQEPQWSIIGIGRLLERRPVAPFRPFADPLPASFNHGQCRLIYKPGPRI